MSLEDDHHEEGRGEPPDKVPLLPPLPMNRLIDTMMVGMVVGSSQLPEEKGRRSKGEGYYRPNVHGNPPCGVVGLLLVV